MIITAQMMFIEGEGVWNGVLTGMISFLTPNQQCQCTDGYNITPRGEILINILKNNSLPSSFFEMFTEPLM